MPRFVEIADVHINPDHVALVTDYRQEGVPYENQPDFKSVIYLANGEEIETTVPRAEIIHRLTGAADLIEQISDLHRMERDNFAPPPVGTIVKDTDGNRYKIIYDDGQPIAVLMDEGGKLLQHVCYRYRSDVFTLAEET